MTYFEKSSDCNIEITAFIKNKQQQTKPQNKNTQNQQNPKPS